MPGMTLTDPIQLPAGQGQKTIDVPASETRYYAITLEATEACMFNLHHQWYFQNHGDVLAIYENGNLIRESQGTLVKDLPGGDYVLRIDASGDRNTLYVQSLS